jgi:ribosomal RNA-processing protein 36
MEEDFLIAPRPAVAQSQSQHGVGKQEFKTYKSKAQRQREKKEAEDNLKHQEKQKKIEKALTKMSIAELHMLKRKKTAEMLTLLTGRFRSKVRDYLPVTDLSEAANISTTSSGDTVHVVTYKDDGSKEDDETEEMTLEEMEKASAETHIRKQRKMLKTELKDLEEEMTKSNKGKRKPKIKRKEQRLCPSEVPISKLPVEEPRLVIQKKTGFTRDPRFDDLSGDLTKERHLWWYKFLKGMRAGETAEIKKELRKERDPERKEQLRSLLHRMKTQEFSAEQRGERLRLREGFMKEQIGRMNEGQRPFFLKKSQEKQMFMVNQYQKLKEMGKLDVYMQRRQRRKCQSGLE